MSLYYQYISKVSFNSTRPNAICVNPYYIFKYANDVFYVFYPYLSSLFFYFFAVTQTHWYSILFPLWQTVKNELIVLQNIHTNENINILTKSITREKFIWDKAFFKLLVTWCLVTLTGTARPLWSWRILRNSSPLFRRIVNLSG
jgi:hypothetical protein